MAINIHEEIRSNKIKSSIVIGSFFFFVAFIGGALGFIVGDYYGPMSLQSFITGAILATLLALIYIFIFFRIGDRMILKSTGAKEASRTNYPFLYHTTEALSIAAGLKAVPKCYIIEDETLNAYATGLKPEKSYIVVTTGLIKKLNRQEIEGVIAHELSHIKNQDVKVMLLAAGLVGVTALLADIMLRTMLFNGEGNHKGDRLTVFIFIFWFLLIILSPLIAKLIKLAISRQREYLADATGAQLTRYPEGLACALEKIKTDNIPLKTASEATAHLFISDPFKGKKKLFLSGLFSTHPPIDDRIARLRGKV